MNETRPDAELLRQLESELSADDRRTLTAAFITEERPPATRAEPGETTGSDPSTILRWTDPAQVGTADRYEEIVRKACQEAHEHLSRARSQQAGVQELLDDLLDQPAPRRRVLVRNRRRLHQLPLLHRLLGESWRLRSVAPGESRELAELALLIIEQLGDEEAAPQLLEDLRARAWGQIGNAHRIDTDLHAATGAFETAWKHLEQGTQDPLERALLLQRHGSLYRDQRRLEEACRLLRQAAFLFGRMADRRKEADALIALAFTYREAGKCARALAVLSRAEPLLGPEDSYLRLCVYHNEVDCLIDLERWSEAEAQLERTRPLYADAPDPLTKLRLPWIEGKIAKGSGRLAEAEALFAEVRNAFIEREIAYDAALVSLELAEIYAAQGRTEELKELAGEMLAVFRSRNVEREALATLLVFKQAAFAERATEALIRELASRLRERQSHHSPAALEPAGV